MTSTKVTPLSTYNSTTTSNPLIYRIYTHVMKCVSAFLGFIALQLPALVSAACNSGYYQCGRNTTIFQIELTFSSELYPRQRSLLRRLFRKLVSDRLHWRIFVLLLRNPKLCSARLRLLWWEYWSVLRWSNSVLHKFDYVFDRTSGSNWNPELFILNCQVVCIWYNETKVGVVHFWGRKCLELNVCSNDALYICRS